MDERSMARPARNCRVVRLLRCSCYERPRCPALPAPTGNVIGVSSELVLSGAHDGIRDDGADRTRHLSTRQHAEHQSPAIEEGDAAWRDKQSRRSRFRRCRHNITAPTGRLAGPSILMWRGSPDTIVERNTFVNCQREIAFGHHSGGVIRNNNAAGGDLHLTPLATTVIDKGPVSSDVGPDWDGESRSRTPDIGADERAPTQPAPR